MVKGNCSESGSLVKGHKGHGSSVWLRAMIKGHWLAVRSLVTGQGSLIGGQGSLARGQG